MTKQTSNRGPVQLSADFIRGVILPIMAETIEGGVANNPRDRGKLTKWGISSRYYPEVLRPDYTQFDAFLRHCQIAVDNHTVDVAQAAKQAGDIDYRFALYYSLLAVNAGEDDAVGVLQGCISADGISLGRSGIDGIYGPSTHRALEQWLALRPITQSANIYLGAIRGFYTVHAKTTNQSHFLSGWLNRMGSNLVVALESGANEVEQQLFPDGLTSVRLA